MDFLLLAALLVVAGIGLVLAVFQLPGTWVILAGAVAYDWYYDWTRLSWKWLVALGVIALAAELFELFAGAIAAKRAGASRKATIGALLGGFVGMLALSVPIPVIGTIIGGVIGCFIGAVVGELSVRNDYAAGAKVGVFAVIGRLMGLLVKTSAAFAIAGVALSVAVWRMWPA